MATLLDKASRQLPYPYGKATRDEETLAAILNALHHHSGFPLECVHVEVRAGRCVLSGAVAQDYQRELAATAAKEAEGVTEVENNILLRS